MSAIPQSPIPPKLTPAEYFKFEQTSVEKHDYINGKLVCMAGGMPLHSLVIANMIITSGIALRGKPCRVYESNLRIGIKRKTLYFYPDLSIICGQPEFESADPTETTVTNPKVLVEVVSETSEAYDRGDKFHRYLEIETLEEYVVVSQKAARVDVFRRNGTAGWLYSTYEGLSATAELKSVSINLPLADIYAGVTFDPPASA